MVIDNFSVSPEGRYLAITGCEVRKNNCFKNVIYIYSTKKMKKVCSTILKVQSQEGGSIKKMSFVNKIDGGLYLTLITDGNYAFYVYELKENELRFVCNREFIHQSRGCLS